MARDSQRIEQEFIATAEEKTGHDLTAWLTIIAASGLEKNQAIIKWLKQEHNLNHMQASMLAGITLNDGKPVFDYAVLFERLFAGKEAQRPLYDALATQIQTSLNDVVLIPTKSYVSLEEQRVFGCIKINKTNLRVGLDLGEQPFDDYLQRAKGLGAMPNIGHMIEISNPNEITDTLIEAMAAAWERNRR